MNSYPTEIRDMTLLVAYRTKIIKRIYETRSGENPTYAASVTAASQSGVFFVKLFFLMFVDSMAIYLTIFTKSI